jgi:hypothetical protein
MRLASKRLRPISAITCTRHQTLKDTLRGCTLISPAVGLTAAIIITPWSTVLEKLTGRQLVKKFPAFYATRRFITAFTRARHLSLSWTVSIQSMPPSHFFKIHFNIILPTMPGSSRLSPSSRSRHQNPVCTSPVPHMCYMPRPPHSSWFVHLNNIWWWLPIIKFLVM